NTPAGNDRGATAFSVNLATGRIRVLATGVATYSFNPGCGAGGEVAITRYLGADEQRSQVLDLDAASGRVLSASTVPEEVTSAVPSGHTVYVAHGDQLQRLSATTGTTIATLPRAVHSLVVNASGGVDMLTTDLSQSTSVWRWAAGNLTRLGAGGSDVALFAGHAGQTVITGARVAPAPGELVLPSVGVDALGASTLGDLELAAPTGKSETAGNLLPRILSADGTQVRAAQAAAPSPGRTAMSTSTTPSDPAAALDARDAPALPPATRAVAPATTSVTTPICAVPRLDVNNQVPQPTNAQIDWAAEQAVQNSLPARPAGFDGLPGQGYSPEADFRQPALAGIGGHVPAVLVEAILAQESNMDQATFHAPPGVPGDPLIANYYGNAGSGTAINYAAADCGYGLGQITDGMKAGGALGLVKQQRVAVDYTENAAATVQILAEKWNELYPAIVVNEADPRILEDWYDVIWSYNSGIEPDAANGNTTGCAPGPSCTDSAGNWGLGWANNPINPVFTVGREPFLSGPNGYADAATPSDWPYQERVFGWMSVPLHRYDPDFGGTEFAYTKAESVVTAPAATTFCDGSNNCDPTGSNGNFCRYTSSAGALWDHCWYHQQAATAC
ncbi:MAG: hypothetical protein ACRDTP_03305, partial [Mycobacteriales bacterium]